MLETMRLNKFDLSNGLPYVFTTHFSAIAAAARSAAYHVLMPSFSLGFLAHRMCQRKVINQCDKKERDCFRVAGTAGLGRAVLFIIFCSAVVRGHDPATAEGVDPTEDERAVHGADSNIFKRSLSGATPSPVTNFLLASSKQITSLLVHHQSCTFVPTPLGYATSPKNKPTTP